MLFQRRPAFCGLALFAAELSGCGGDARVELAAADSMDAIRAGLAQSLTEYHADLAALDEQRRAAATDALIDRLRSSLNDEAGMDAHAESFRQAMARLEADREAAWKRYAVSLDTVTLLGDIAADLRRLAADSMTVNDEAKRYFTDVVQQRRDLKAHGVEPDATPQALQRRVVSDRKVTP